LPTVYRLLDWYADLLYTTELTFPHSWSDTSRSIWLDVRNWIISRNQFSSWRLAVRLWFLH